MFFFLKIVISKNDYFCHYLAIYTRQLLIGAQAGSRISPPTPPSLALTRPSTVVVIKASLP
jgi:hypothetical protein